MQTKQPYTPLVLIKKTLLDPELWDAALCAANMKPFTPSELDWIAARLPLSYLPEPAK